MPVEPSSSSPASPARSDSEESLQELIDLLLDDVANDTSSSPPPESVPTDFRDLLHDGELYWRDHYNWLLERGYRLRPRYSPEWVPSWDKDPEVQGISEDSLVFIHSNINDAIQISQDRHVVLKRVSRSEDPEEVSILDYFSKEPLSSQPENHCVPLIEILHPPGDPDHDIVVLPVLRQYDNPEFETIGEAIDFIQQLLEGFTFLHEHRVAHRDVKVENLMMDPEAMQFQRFHFCLPGIPHEFKDRRKASPISWRFSRTERRPKYYIIDFGYSSQYTEEQMPPRDRAIETSDDSLPELKDQSKLYNPFPSDVYYVGNMLRRDFLDGFGEYNRDRTGRLNFEFLRSLVEAMTKEDPEERITMKDALETFDSIVATLPSATLRSRVIPRPEGRIRKEGPIQTVTRSTMHWCRRFRYIVKRLPPIPSSTSS
ncbi:other/AgaK1 protein kinase [Coprinopsis cinerea okayama7|uniref:Other/AgaK1 protein kinase n=1 Tax=Coprinopsis cinerea (strain Okayama-7 / 130 / ATCC MYA-4618 / FGSC 9003) TaxID=240176 RepID=A8P7Z2_COPC7|nr:other/AgaK1 protein kinase [Coprinopsis cinerea okayama7\|eukprot:XP_001839461.1 other/AgaK1 protein kinase [Coprinopsis cinerea okayama7\